MKVAYEAFYSSVTAMLNNFFPPVNIIITSRDPPYVTAAIKYLLRPKNALLRRGQIKKANALAIRIGTSIIACNADRLKSETGELGSVDLWAAARDITGKR